jgi:transposase
LTDARIAGGAARAMTRAKGAGGGGRSISLRRCASWEADAPRVRCKRHGVVVAGVPWARHDAGVTRSFEDQTAWLTVNTSKTAVSELMRVAWRTVGWICERVAAEAQAQRDLFSGLKRLGVDEISVRKGQRYLTIVIDHDTGRLVWAHPGRDKQTVYKFLDLLGTDRCQQIQLVSCDMADWIAVPIAERCPNAEVCLDPFHVIKLSNDALDEVRREVWNDTRKAGQPGLARELKGARFALWMNPERLTERHQQKLARVQAINKDLYRAYLIAQQLRMSYRVPCEQALELLDAWLKWARRCRLAPFIKLAKTITKQRPWIEAALRNGLSNARVRTSKHPDPADHPTRVRIPLPSRRDRARDARPRRALATTTRTVTPPTVHAGGSFFRPTLRSLMVSARPAGVDAR